MSTTDPIADMLTRIRNAGLSRRSSVTVPHSKIKASIAQILKDEGFVRDIGVVRNGAHKAIKLFLIYKDKTQPAIAGLERVSKPSLRIYAGRGEVPRVYGGTGTAIVSTSKGVMTGKQAWKEKIGGEVLCIVW